jgi:hypothetical protein
MPINGFTLLTWDGWKFMGVLLAAISLLVAIVLAPSRDTLRRRINSKHHDDRKWLKATLGAAPVSERYELAVSEVGKPRYRTYSVTRGALEHLLFVFV